MDNFFLLGCADDRGVSNNNGRPGAAEGPVAFYKYFQKIKSKYDWPEFSDFSIPELSGSIADSHEKISQALISGYQSKKYSIVIGGGHDYAYPHLKGSQNSFDGKLGCINIDPHFDLRQPSPAILSGSPFHMAIENDILEGENLIEFGIGKHCNGQELWEYAKSKNVNTVTFPEIREKNKAQVFEEKLNELEKNTDAIVVSLDLDAIQAAFAPGVSAPAAEGFFPSEILEMIAIAAKNDKVCSLGIYELNPRYDIDDQTARFAALAAFEFILNKT